MNIVAVAVEPEFVVWEDDESGTARLTLEIARLQCTDTADLTRGSVQLHLLPADIATIERALAARHMGEAHSRRVEQ